MVVSLSDTEWFFTIDFFARFVNIVCKRVNPLQTYVLRKDSRSGEEANAIFSVQLVIKINNSSTSLVKKDLNIEITYALLMRKYVVRKFLTSQRK